jgi:hypothetical protein
MGVTLANGQGINPTPCRVSDVDHEVGLVDEVSCADTLGILHGDAGFGVDQGGLAGTPGEISQGNADLNLSPASWLLQPLDFVGASLLAMQWILN